jgi:hypothetical protein
MAIRSFNDLNKNQQLGVLIGLPAFVAIIIMVMIYRSLGVLGQDPGDGLPNFMHRNLPENKWQIITGLNDQISAKDVIIARRPVAEKKLANLESDIKAARERLPLESEKIEMRLLIEKLARDIPSDIGTVQVRSVKITENSGAQAASRAPGAQNKPEQITYQTDITGDLNGIIKYIDMIEKNPRFMLVNSFSLKPGKVGVDTQADNKQSLQPHEVKMSIITYVYNPGGN